MPDVDLGAPTRTVPGDLKPVFQLCSLLRGWFDASPPAELEAIAWGAVLATAVATKTIGLLRVGAARRGVGLPGPVLDTLAEHEAAILKNNAANLAWTLRAAAAFEKAGITAIFFKGALWIREVYGSIGMRASSDVDVLVARRDYDAAGAALATIGYAPLVGRSDRWWHEHLGESPYARDGGGPIIDLHHQVQQPGGPYPRHLDEFLADHVTLDFNGKTIRTLSRDHGLLLSAIGYGKAARAKTPWLSYAHELLTLRHGDTGALASVTRLAQHNGISNLFGDYLGKSLSLFDAPEPSGEAAAEPIVLSAIGRPRESLFYRTRKTWGWSDGKFVARSIAFGWSLLRVLRETASMLMSVRAAKSSA